MLLLSYPEVTNPGCDQPCQSLVTSTYTAGICLQRRMHGSAMGKNCPAQHGGTFQVQCGDREADKMPLLQDATDPKLKLFPGQSVGLEARVTSGARGGGQQ